MNWKFESYCISFNNILGPGEYFYKRPTQGQYSASTVSSISVGDDRLGEHDEFEQMSQRYQERQRNTS